MSSFESVLDASESEDDELLDIRVMQIMELGNMLIVLLYLWV
jgi:hypothetical protein